MFFLTSTKHGTKLMFPGGFFPRKIASASPKEYEGSHSLATTEKASVMMIFVATIIISIYRNKDDCFIVPPQTLSS